MNRPRPARPTDIYALVSFDGRVYPNEARPWDQLGHDAGGPHALGAAFEQWFSFATGRSTWVSVQGQTVRGVVSARRRAKRTAWEIDTLIAASDEPGPVAMALFDQAIAGATAAGVHTLYLRLDAGSPLLEPASRAGFVAYARETLLRLDPPFPDDAPPPGVSLRPCDKTDAHTLYQLYTRATPADVRRVEASTFQEWLALQDIRVGGRGRLNLIAERDGQAVAWVRAGRDGGQGRLLLLCHPDAWPEVEALLGAGLEALKADAAVYSLVPHHAVPVLERLAGCGFQPVAEYVALAKRLALPVRELKPRRVAVPALVKPLIAKPLAPALPARSARG